MKIKIAENWARKVKYESSVITTKSVFTPIMVFLFYCGLEKKKLCL